MSERVPDFIFMLTSGDKTVSNALDVYDEVRDLPLRYVGFKDVGVPLERLGELVARIHADGREVMLEVVSERREDEVRSAESAVALNVDFLLGGTHAEHVAPLVEGRGIGYFPFPGRVTGHPSELVGTIAEIVASARRLAAMDVVGGLDLLAYRFAADPEGLIAAVVDEIELPIIVAGSIDRREQIRRLAELGVWAFTVGSAIFDRRFLGPQASLHDQVEEVCRVAGAALEPARDSGR